MRAQNAYDTIVVGAGIVGLATARALLLRRPGLRLAVVDKEASVGAHQTSHNSGVVHAGIYYKPGSLKAKLCVAGARRMLDYAQVHDIPFERCGKLIVATYESELAALKTLHDRASANGVGGVEHVDADGIRAREPHAAGIAGLWSPETAIIDFGQVAASYAREIIAAGGQVLTGCRVTAMRRDSTATILESSAGELHAKSLINCAGLYSDRIAAMAGVPIDVRIVPFRGEYYRLSDEKAPMVRGLIYPVPDPRFPFLGVHFTRSVYGNVEAGPNAVLALAREGYRWSSIRASDIAETAGWPGFWRMAKKYWRVGMGEVYRSASKRAFAAALRRLLPELTTGDLVVGGSGVRAQAVRRDGSLVDDFAVIRIGPDLHVLNVPSPAATASLAIADYLVDMLD